MAHTLEERQAEAAKAGFQLVSGEYHNNSQELEFVCPGGHNFKMSWRNFSRDRLKPRCPVCYRGNRKKTLEEVQSEVARRGFHLLSPEYLNNTKKLSFLCPEGHAFDTTWHNFSAGYGCSVCTPNRVKTQEELSALVVAEGYKLSSTYKNNWIKMDFACPVGHQFLMTWSDFQGGHRCPVCAGRQRKTLEEVRAYVEEYGLKLLSTEYKNDKTKLLLQCPKNHEFLITWHDLMHGHGCGLCTNKNEKKVRDLLIRHKVCHQHPIFGAPKNVRPSGRILVDFYLPDANAVIEYHGKQHYEYIPYFHRKGIKVFHSQQARDQWLRDHCDREGILYVEIPYWADAQAVLLDAGLL